jgi:nicotinamidase-related amidase
MMKNNYKSALLVMDVQHGIIDRVNEREEYVERVKAAVGVAHKTGIPVIFVVVGFRSGFPEVSIENKMFSTMKEAAQSTLVDPSPIIETTGSDIVVVKRRVSAFSGSDLEVILRAQGIKHLVLTGVATGGVVLSTVREAADKDYQLTILSDLCADSDPEVNAVLLEKIFPRQAAVLTSVEWART